MLTHPLLEACGVEHGFGTRTAPEPTGLERPRQVHGNVVWELNEPALAEPREADAIVSSRPGQRIGIATADCLPVLVATRSGERVAAIHAGWRGLVAGVLPAAIAHVGQAEALVAVIGPHIGPCCYEIDAPVVDAMASVFEADLAPALRPTRPGHHALDLGALARAALARSGISPRSVGEIPDACTRCDAERFHSFRRDGPRSGRLLHFIAARKMKSRAS